MKQTSVFRVTGDICFYFAVLNVFSVFRAWRLPMALFTALCFALGFVIVRCRQGAARFALSVLPALSFLLSPLQPLLLFPAIAWVYYMLVMVRGNYVMPLYEYRKSFSVLLAICLFFLAANIANATIYWGQVISAESLAYAFAFLLLGVTAMRRMQMGVEMPLNWRLRNAASVVGLPVLAVGVSLLLFLLLRFSQGALRAILEPVGRFFLWLFHKLFPDGHSPVEEMSLREFMKPETNALPLDLEYDAGNGAAAISEETGFTRMRLEHFAGIGAWVVLGILLALALYFVFHYVRRNQPENEDELEVDETEPAAAQKRKRGKKAAPLAGNARQLRRVYKTYLEFRRAKGLRVGPADTSEEILHRETEMGIAGDAQRLRELYIAARYGDPAAVTRSQVLEAQACLERMVSQNSQKASL